MRHSKYEDPLSERERRYHNISHINYDYNIVDLNKGQDNGKSPELNDKDKEAEEFAKNLLETMQHISKEIKEMRIDIMMEPLRRFHQG